MRFLTGVTKVICHAAPIMAKPPAIKIDAELAKDIAEQFLVGETYLFHTDLIETYQVCNFGSFDVLMLNTKQKYVEPIPLAAQFTSQGRSAGLILFPALFNKGVCGCKAGHQFANMLLAERKMGEIKIKAGEPILTTAKRINSTPVNLNLKNQVTDIGSYPGVLNAIQFDEHFQPWVMPERTVRSFQRG